MKRNSGFPFSRSLLDLAENASDMLLNFTTENQCEIDYVQGHMIVGHKTHSKIFPRQP